MARSYRAQRTGAAPFQLVTTLGALAVLLWGLHAALDRSPVFAAALVLPAAGLLVRTFVIMHDCAHGSFVASRRLNDAVGVIMGVLALTPFVQWRRDHALQERRFRKEARPTCRKYDWTRPTASSGHSSRLSGGCRNRNSWPSCAAGVITSSRVKRDESGRRPRSVAVRGPHAEGIGRNTTLVRRPARNDDVHL